MEFDVTENKHYCTMLYKYGKKKRVFLGGVWLLFFSFLVGYHMIKVKSSPLASLTICPLHGISNAYLSTEEEAVASKRMEF